MKIFLIIVGIVVLAVILSAVWRSLRVRSRGASLLVRTKPRSGLDDWRHGVGVYRGDIFEFYKLRSLWPSADLVIDRRYAEISGSRRPTEEETEVIAADSVIVDVNCPTYAYEFALAQNSARAIVSWIEAAPSRRQVQTDRRALLNKVKKTRKR